MARLQPDETLQLALDLEAETEDEKYFLNLWQKI